MKTNRLIIYIGLLTLLLSCTDSENISDEERTRISKEVQGRLDGYIDALNRHDLNWFQTFWSNEKDFVFAGDGLINTNYDAAITKSYGAAFTDIKEFSYLNWTNGHALVLNEKVVSYATNFDWQAIRMSGDTIKAKGSWLYVFRKSDGQWKVVHSAGTHIYN